MSFKTVIRKVEVTGAEPFLGFDEFGAPVRSKDPDKVMRWLCDAYRFRFNEMRSRRHKYFESGVALLVSLGGDNVDNRTIKEARLDFPWLRSVPDLIFLAAEGRERSEWLSNAKRHKTLAARGDFSHHMPGFQKSKNGRQFTIMYNKGRGYSFKRYSRTHAEVIIGGLNYPSVRYKGDGGAYFQIHIHFRPSSDFEDATSLTINWTDNTILFTKPVGKREHKPTGRQVGADLGVKHELTLDDGTMLDLPLDRIKEIEKQIRNTQRAMSRCVNASKYKGDKAAYVKHGPSKRYLKLRERLGKLHAKKRRIIFDWQHKASNRLVKENDLIVMENINFHSMIRRPKPKPDPKHPGKFLPNKSRAKAHLNHDMQRAALGRMRGMVRYKAKAADVDFLTVPAEYTSQMCHVCGFVSAANRESQAVFRCKRCGWTDNADVNAAINILNKGLRMLLHPEEEPTLSLPGEARPRHGTGAQDQKHGKRRGRKRRQTYREVGSRSAKDPPFIQGVLEV